MTRQRPHDGGRSQDTTGFSNPIVVLIRYHLNKFRDRLCRLICGDRLFNRDMSLELDRRLIDAEQLSEIKKILDREN